jgi:hypothetical protein
MKVVIALLICIIFLMPVNVLFSTEPNTDTNRENKSTTNVDDGYIESVTRGTTTARSNYQIVTAKEVSMPEVNVSWIQSDWSGGSGQAEWSDDSKYDSSNNIDDSNLNGPLKLDEGEDIDIWEHPSDGYGRRYRHRMVWNPTREVFYTFGGVAGSGNVVNELYEYNPANGVWTPLATGPSARCAPLVVYDAINNLLWVYGGRDEVNPGGTQFNDLWSYNPNNNQWTQRLGPPGKQGRSDAGGAFNPNTREIIVYGGYIGGGAYSSYTIPRHRAG